MDCTRFTELLPFNTDTEVPEEKYFNRYVREKVCASEPRKWEDLGKELLKDKNIPALTARTHDMNEKQSCSEMFKVWFETQHKPTWRQLIRALQNIGLDQLADNIENLLIQSPRQSKVQLVQAQNQDGGKCCIFYNITAFAIFKFLSELLLTV